MSTEQYRRSHHAGGSSRGTRHDRGVGHLDRQVLVVDERPSPLYLAGLEVVTEGAKMWVSKEATVGVVGWSCISVRKYLLMIYFFSLQLRQPSDLVN